MSNHNTRKRSTPQDLYYYRPLHIWAKCAGILPNFNLNHLHTSSRLPYWNGILMAVVFSSIYAYTTYGKISYMLYAFPPSIFITDVGGDIALYMANITSIIRISLIKTRSIRKFLEHMKKIDVELRSINENIKYPRRVFIIEFISTNIIFVVYYIYDAYIWVESLTWNTYKWYFVRDVQCFHVIILSLVMRNYSLAIRNRVKILNGLLLQMKPPYEDGNRSSDITTGLIHVMNSLKHTDKRDIIKKQHWQVKKLRRIYARICVSIGIYNDIFGWIYLVLYIAIVVYLLTSSNIALVYGIGSRKIGQADFGFTLLILCVLWSALPLVSNQ